MFALFLLTTLLISVSIAFRIDAQFLSDSDRIVGGSEAEASQFPYQVSLRVGKPPRHNCGGSIISEHWIITAAHCIPRNSSTLVAAIGAHHYNDDGVIQRLKKIIVHENYRPSTLENDIALLQTAEEIVFSNGVLPIALSRRHVDGGVRAVVSGWGRLVAVSVAVVKNGLQLFWTKFFLLTLGWTIARIFAVFESVYDGK